MARVAVDLLHIRDADDRIVTTLAWGDEIGVVGQTEDELQVELTRFVEEEDGSVVPRDSRGFVKRPPKSSKLTFDDLVSEQDGDDVLKIDFVDVQQGDASLIETPGGRVILVDGGDNQLFARFLANRYGGTSAGQPKHVDCIVVTHGDADHFAGLTEIWKSEQHETARKRLFISPQRVYHNGLVKRPSARRELEQLGPTTAVGRKTFVTGLETDLLAVSDHEMNQPFRAWKDALTAYSERSPIEFRRLAIGDDGAFQFLADEEISVSVLGPITEDVAGVPGLVFLREPPRRPGGRPGGNSASHTINGHSIVFRLDYGSWSFLYAGDLNAESAAILANAHADDLRSHVFKVPHHGSADFSNEFFEAVSPLVSVVSSGDESARKEYIHPRATLMSALGKYSRGREPLVFVTELVAFFQVEGWTRSAGEGNRWFYAFSRAAFGLVRVRTDGTRLLVYTNSGQTDMKEAYAYELVNGEPERDVIRQA